MRYRLLSALLGLVLCGSGVAVAQSGFIDTFDGAPAAPLPYPTMAPLAAWDVQVHSRDAPTFYQLEPMNADHGPHCEAPPAQHALTGNYSDAVFQCSNHFMTAIMAGGYGVIYLTPPALLDWTNGPATLTFDMSTLRTSGRDWINVWVSPYEQHMALPLDIMNVDLNGPPQNALDFKMDQGPGNSIFRVYDVRNFQSTELQDCWYCPYDTYLTPSAIIRTTFQLTLSQTHVKFGIPSVNLWYVDQDIAPLTWTQGVIQLGHHSYNPRKDCNPGDICQPDTWHWDNVSLSPATPFTITRARERFIDPTQPAPFTFPVAADAQTMLQFAALGDAVQLSTDGGTTWQDAHRQPTGSADWDHSKFQSYWTAVPVGTSAVLVRAQGGWWGSWFVRDASLWSQTAPRPRTPTPTAVPPTATAVPPTATIVPPTRTVTPLPTATDLPTATPQPTITATPIGQPTPTATAAPRCARVDTINGGLYWTPLADSQCMQ